jgi:imidazoleglycerol-phosphate dehydratase
MSEVDTEYQPVIIDRRTRETAVRVELATGHGNGAGHPIATGEPFLDHMLTTLARYAGWHLTVQARGDLRHHLIEDVAIAIGAAVAQLAAGPIARYGERTVPMDDALVQAVVDVGGRPYYRGPLPSSLYEHWMRSFADHARATLHLRVLRGRDRHHVVESAFKALGFALRDALMPSSALMSTKGRVLW